MGEKRILTILFLLALAIRLLPGPRTIDDAYITFRYARDILAGNGFVFNPGEPVLGTTTPLYTILLSFLGLFSGGAQAPFPQIAWVVNAAADGLTCLLLFYIGKRLGSSAAGLAAALVWALAPFSVTFAIGGLETSLYVLLLIAMVAVYLNQRLTLTAALAALALLTRPDALILIGLLGLDWLLTWLRAPQRRFPWRALVVFGLLALPWLVFARLTFGSPIPHSISAKSLAYRLPAAAGFGRLLQHYATPFQEDVTFGPAGIRAGLVLYPFLFIIGAIRGWRAMRRSWVLWAYPWLYFAVFAAANPLIFRWYLTPPLPAYILGILFGLEEIGAAAWSKVKQKQRQISSAQTWSGYLLGAFLLALVPVLLLLNAWSLHPDHGPGRPAPDMAWFKLELLYRQAAEILKPRLSSQTVLAAGDVGVLGYFTPARILDTVGLNSPQATRYYPLDPAFYTINYAIAPDLILDEQPDFVVILEVYGREGLLKDPRFWEDYRLLQKIPTDIYGSDGLLILEKKPTP